MTKQSKNQLVIRAKTKGRKLSVTNEGLKLIAKLAADGVALTSIARHLGISGPAFIRLRKEDTEVAEAVEVGRSDLETEMVGVLTEAARKENIVAAMFILKGQRGWKEGTPREVINKTEVNVTIGPALSQKEFDKLVELPPEDVEDVTTQKVIR
jgi:hypothetical protein